MQYSKLILAILLVLLICPAVLGATATDDTTRAMRDLQNTLEMNKAQIVKSINDANSQMLGAINSSIDNNFAVMDTRIQQFNKDTTRNMAIVVVGGFLMAFVLSQIIRISIERKRRKLLIKQRFELEQQVNQLEHDAKRLSEAVAQYQRLEKEYSAKLGAMAGKKKHTGTIMLCILTFCIGALAVFALYIFKVL
jgi:uncharacterized protein involved in exopolysaccharide biosynthesis